MPSNRLTFVAVALACMLAAGAGGYFATRQNAVPTPAAAAPAASNQAVPAVQPVQETEAVVGEAPKTEGPAPAPVAPSAKASAAKSPAAPAKTAKAPAAPTANPAPPLDRSWPSSTSTASAQQAQTPPSPTPADNPASKP